ncbi:helix-turn-helix transcriptional regulator [Kibdelosporangium aridum]|uniref:helix-turn-helix domain-containing protein n=1 Tax=Kibdelosporangium aridum TaxID=2030 RepID=UPI000F77FEEF|nr:helix-turn-helix transcriptional regulator [Kibdelosporangium aridum]
MTGDLPEAIALIDRALTRHRASDRWTAPALAIFPMREMAAGLAGDTGQAMALLDECRNMCARLGERWVLSWALGNVGIAWWAAGNRQQALVCLCDALRVKRHVIDQFGYAVCVDLLSWVAAAEGDWTRAAVLQGAANKMWESIGTPLGGFADLIDEGTEWRTGTRGTLGERTYQTAAEHGAGMPTEEVIAYVLGEKPPTPTAGPAETPAATPGLTKREWEVATLIAQGLTNREIADRLVIAQRTAEGHVERILAKLGFTKRVQIVAWMAGQRELPAP